MAANIKMGSIALSGAAQQLSLLLDGAQGLMIAAYPANAADDLVIGDSTLTLTTGLPISKAAGPVNIEKLTSGTGKLFVMGTAGGRVGFLALLP